ncbi:MAG TPA: DNA alkylation repair protein [Methanocorpusculum sp.]|nr:DNA alkylation repair protein [Methanocorpusculum sp.]
MIPAERVKAVKDELNAAAEQTYAAFSSSLLPKTEHLLGVRVPLLRKIARREAKSGWKAFLHAADDSSFEMVMLQGMVIGYATADPEEIIDELDRFVPKITNWSVCDSTVSTLKTAETHPDIFFSYASSCIDSDREYTVRFGIVMLLMHFINDRYYSSVLDLLNRPAFPGYYASMAAAWAVSVLYVKYPNETETWLSTCVLDDATFEKALRKIRESFRVSDTEKKRLNSLNRHSLMR